MSEQHPYLDGYEYGLTCQPGDVAAAHRLDYANPYFLQKGGREWHRGAEAGVYRQELSPKYHVLRQYPRSAIRPDSDGWVVWIINSQTGGRLTSCYGRTAVKAWMAAAQWVEAQE